MTQAPAPSQALRINPVALRQKVTQQLDRHRNGEAYPVMVVRAEPAWPHDPAMLLWLNGADSSKWEPNENYAREVMELFCLGADPGLDGRIDFHASDLVRVRP